MRNASSLLILGRNCRLKLGARGRNGVGSWLKYQRDLLFLPSFSIFLNKCFCNKCFYLLYGFMTIPKTLKNIHIYLPVMVVLTEESADHVAIPVVLPDHFFF